MKILFVAIVKNEAAVLERCLESCRGVATDYLVCDTGSTDETVDIAERFGTVRTIPFENYAVAKNKALELADEMTDPGDWILLLDADESIEQGADRLVQHAADGKADCISARIVERANGMAVNAYYRNRMWRARTGWRFEGPGVHEVLCGQGQIVKDGSVVVLHDHAHRTPDVVDGLADRFQHYVDTFLEAIAKNPEDARSWFYLARTYKDLNRWWESIDAYERYLTIQPNWFVDERWQASYDVALIWKTQGEYDKAFASLNRAIQIDPARAESFCLCGALHYARQDWLAAIPFFEEAVRRPYPESVVLFIDPRQYHAVPIDFLCLCYHQTKQFAKSAELSNRLLSGGSR